MIGFYDVLGTRLVGATTITRAIEDGAVAAVVLPTYETLHAPFVAFTSIGNAFVARDEHFYLYTLAYDALIMAGTVGTRYVTPDIYGVAYELTIVRNGAEYNDVSTRHAPATVVDPREARAANERALGASVVYTGTHIRVNEKTVAFTLDVDRVQAGTDAAFASLRADVAARVETLHVETETVHVASNASIDGDVAVAHAASIGGSLDVSGAVRLRGAAVSVAGRLTVAGDEVATRVYVDSVKQSILGDASLPAALDTLSEIADALQGDGGFGVTVMQRIDEATARLNGVFGDRKSVV
jgi:hypothetical protein